MINIREYSVEAMAEYITGYGDDGWIPVYIADTFCNGRYEIINKLGFGSCATVWAARDHHDNVDVSIKVIKAAYSLDNRELRILQHIQQGADHPGRKYLPRLLNHFDVCLGGKKNLFIVLELLGPPLSLVHYRPCTYTPTFSRRISQQILLAVDCLHSYGIVHGGNIHEGNVLFRLVEGFQLPLQVVHQGRVYRKDGAPLEGGLPHQVVTPLWEGFWFDEDLFREVGHIQLIDFSSSFFDSETPTWIHTRGDRAPPELIFRKPLNKSVDVWSLACMVRDMDLTLGQESTTNAGSNQTFYVATGRNLFETRRGGRRLLIAIHTVVGESSAQWLLKALFEAIVSSTWKDLGTYPFDYVSETVCADVYLDLETELIEEIGNPDRALPQYIRQCLVVDPSKRATTSQLRDQEYVQ
ncbi:kinase-like domain-containing protein [Lophiotrema nucula]|uniref:Kinase-like domain-containing protein n=1 Tax=Lophiotrema nucula TaxID=690887 RepID=A0A6A5YD13_9PLEO|nr:kinase-like domain-containing protein [Lophiotrema nucula]